MRRIAVVAPLTGAVAQVGNSAVAAVRLALNDLGDPLELTVVDDACDPAIGIAAVSELTRDARVIGVVGHYCSVVALAVTPIYAEAGLPLVVWGAHHVDITENRLGPGIFRLCGTFRHEARATVALAQKNGWQRIALLRDDTPYGREHAALFTAAWLSAGGSIAGEKQDPLLLQDADALWIAAAPEAWWKAFAATAGIAPRERSTTATLIAAARRAGWTKPIVATAAAMIDSDTLDAINPNDAAVFTLSEAHVPPALLADGGRFDERYRTLQAVPPLSPYARYAYAAATLLGKLIGEGAQTRVAVGTALAAANGRTTSVGIIDFDGSGQQDAVAIAGFNAHRGEWHSIGLM
ncbi:MAG: ABC transporter substrate-binding protein [Rhodoferax sp.]|nr:ABC transporter substrate-binding protein [Rhodoferax sp.]